MNNFDIYKKSGTKKKGIYGSRKIRDVINQYTINGKKVNLSRHQVLNLMKEMGNKSKYNTNAYRPYSNKLKAEKYYPNLITQDFDNWRPLEVIPSDLTYVKTANGWRYICFIVDLFNREIIGYSVFKYHDTDCVLRALESITYNLNETSIFHSDRGGEFASNDLSQYLEQFGIKQSMSKAGCPFDNAVSENMFKLLKTEGIGKYYEFDNNLIIDVNERVKWYNNVRIHSKINYTAPVLYCEQQQIKSNLTINRVFCHIIT